MIYRYSLALPGSVRPTVEAKKKHTESTWSENTTVEGGWKSG
jgi:hypothetical protein